MKMLRSWKVALVLWTTLSILVPVVKFGMPQPSAAGTTYIDIINDALVVGGGTSITKTVVYKQTLNPTASTAAVGVKSDAFTVSGILPSDKIYVMGPAPTALCPMVSARATGTNEVTIDYAVLTAAVCTGATGTYGIVAIRSA